MKYKEPVYLESGTEQFMIMPTQNTPYYLTVDQNTLKKELKDEYDYSVKTGGLDPVNAAAWAVNKIASKYKMVYYEGEKGVFNKANC